MLPDLKKAFFLISVFCLLSSAWAAQAAPWSGILDPSRAIDWTQSGVPGGIPNRPTLCATINASTYGNGTSDATSGIQTALNSCVAGQVVSLSAGTFRINGKLVVPSNVTLRGQGANQTVLKAQGSGGAVITLGNTASFPNINASVSISAGATGGSQTLTLASAAGISVGSYLLITELNDPTYVTDVGADGTCTWCDGGLGWNGTRLRGQIVEVTSVNGASVGIAPGLYSNYSHTPLATPFTAAAKLAGVEDLQVFANNTGYSANFAMAECADCWISGVESNYTDGDHVEVDWSYRGQIQNSYFSNAYLHTPGTYDSDVVLRNKSSGLLVQNNILERLHSSVMVEWGAAGNVIAYNYMFGNFDASSNYWTSSDVSAHGAHPQFNLFEGNSNVSSHFDSDWGSASNDTLFRNFVRGTGENCNPLTGRGSVICTPMGQPGGSGVNGWWTPEGVRSESIDFLGTNYNSVGNILGSVDTANLNAYDDPGSGHLTQTRMVVAVCGPTPCGPGSRDNFTTAYDYSLGFGESSDDGSSGFDSVTPYNTLFLHGDYASATHAITWTNNITHTLPPSFYLSSKPSWFGSAPWPLTGPDVTGGLSNAFGFANATPAERCYEQVMGGTDGSGSPLAFNAAACYGTGSGGGPFGQLYISQSGAGDQSGQTDCTHAQPVTFFNAPGSWGTGNNQIGPDTTVHLCGTFTGAANANLLTVKGSGTSGHPITIFFESGANRAILTAPYWNPIGGAINFNNQSNIVVDGGVTCGYDPAANVTTPCNGTIQNTQNGTTLAFQQGTLFIDMGNGTGCEVKNLNLLNAYQRSGSNEEIDDTVPRMINYDGGTIDHNVMNMGGWCVVGVAAGPPTLDFHHNDVGNCEHDLQGAPTTLLVHDNHFHDWGLWDSTNNNYHHDGIHCYCGANGCTQTAAIYNNQFDGDVGHQHGMNQLIFLEGAGSDTQCILPGGTVYQFNNVFAPSSQLVAWGGNYGNSTTGDVGDVYANNTGVGPNSNDNASAMIYTNITNNTIENNALGGAGVLIGQHAGLGVSNLAIDHNAYENCSSLNCFAYSGVDSGNWAVWQAGTCTGHANTCDPNGNQGLTSSTYFNLNPLCTPGSVGKDCSPQAGSPLIQAGANLTSLCTGMLTPLCKDKAGNPRPISGPWDIGAYQTTGLSGGSDIFINQNGTAGDTGANCSTAHSVTWFNTAANWSATPVGGKIGPGTTVHLCGTFSAASANTTMLTAQGNGQTGNPVTILFQAGAVLTSPAWPANGAIYINGHSNITIDGGTNGVIQATASGVGLANNGVSTGIHIDSGVNIVVKNLTVSNMFVRQESDTDSSCDNIPASGCGMGIQSWGTGSGITVSNVTVHDASVGIQVVYPGNGTTSNIALNNNTISRTHQGILVIQTNCTGTVNGLVVDQNTIFDGFNWSDPNDDFHLNGIMLSVSNGCSGGSNTNTITAPRISNNRVYGNWGAQGHMTANLFLSQDSGGTFPNARVFNNVFDQSTTYSSNGAVYCQGGCIGIGIYNNTFYKSPNGGGYGLLFQNAPAASITFENNIVQGTDYYFDLSAGSLQLADHNLYNGGNTSWKYGSNEYSTLTAWQTASGMDAHSSSSFPNLNSGYIPQAGSPAIGLGANLTSLGILTLDRDKSGTPRPGGSTPWDAGAYQSGSSGSSPCDVNGDGTINIADVQLEVNMALGVTPCTNDLNHDGVCNVIDVQRVANAALGGQCITGP